MSNHMIDSCILSQWKEIVEFIHGPEHIDLAIDGIGCDILEIQRFSEAYKRIGSTFLNRIFTIDEQQPILCSYKNPIPSFAARFAAKEALSKALGCGIGHNLSWHDMQIFKNSQGKPYVVWSNHAQNTHMIQQTYLSLSHSNDYALAFAIIKKYLESKK